ncbi:MAG: class I SAM-dependent methyltransferase [Pseudomonadales bacterium]|nr:class I SAM-dependent methyltransferase [Pseudomonadales bacterium]
MLEMYGDLARWWPLLSPVEDYAEEARFFVETFRAAGLPADATLLELGAGGGNNAWHMKSAFRQVTLTDLSADMLAISRDLNPDCEHVQGDMRTLRLGRAFDAVFVHDAIEYMTTPTALREAVATAWVHLRPGGLALFVPDSVRETFAPGTEHGGVDGDGRGLRYLEWLHDPDPSDSTCTVEYVCLLRETGKPVRVVHETHTYGLFARAEWLGFLHETGFVAEVLIDGYERELFLARKPA